MLRGTISNFPPFRCTIPKNIEKAVNTVIINGTELCRNILTKGIVEHRQPEFWTKRDCMETRIGTIRGAVVYDKRDWESAGVWISMRWGVGTGRGRTIPK